MTRLKIVKLKYANQPGSEVTIDTVRKEMSDTVRDAVDQHLLADNPHKLDLTPSGIGAEPAGAVQSALAVQNFAFPALQNSWEPGFAAPTIQKQGNIVILSGILSNLNLLSQDTLIGTLPPECRPNSSKFFVAAAIVQNQSGEVFPLTDAILISPSGQLFGSVLNDNRPLKFLYLFLDNCCFFAPQKDFE